MNHRIAALAAGLLLALSTQAQTPAAATPAAPKPLVLKAAHLFDGRSGTLVSPGVVVIQG
ncbi:MAG: amidohydrolase family protein, partial [Proteobacteria bacterium]|nr:amidohydrolase family protein [Pseudomonadota bacterium]